MPDTAARARGRAPVQQAGAAASAPVRPAALSWGSERGDSPKAGLVLRGDVQLCPLEQLIRFSDAHGDVSNRAPRASCAGEGTAPVSRALNERQAPR